ncbi:MAG TPA: hypothetical protein PL029_07445 [Bacteroidia bacterium]|nr:hypothetical protein [Bacteroidia bacterium]
MKNKSHIIFWILLVPVLALAQNNTFSPYSRYALGELTAPTLAHNSGMGGAFIAMKPDSMMPIFINTGNPAAYALIKLTSLEVGGSGVYSKFSGDNTSVTRWSTNFSYGALGFPIANNGGACFGIMPYSHVGYDLQNKVTEGGIGEVSYLYNGSGGLNKAFIGYGIMPFSKRFVKFRGSQAIPDSLKTLRGNKYRVAEMGAKVLSDFSIGFNVNYIFGGLQNTTRVIYPNSVLYNNTFRERTLTLGDFTGNFGIQSAFSIDSVADKRGRKDRINGQVAALKAMGYSEEMLKNRRDSLNNTTPLRKRAMSEKTKITFGYFMALNNALDVTYSSAVYNYITSATGQEIIRDTVIYRTNQKSTVSLPLEQGFGIGYKKGERVNAVVDFAITNWQNFKYLDNVSDFKNNYRIAAGVNFVPEKYAAGHNAFLKRINYRLGVSYQTGFIELKNTLITNYALTAGMGFPVGIGRLSSMVNLSVQYGQVGTSANNLTKENYIRFNFGFTFSDRWFQKMRYD